MVTHQVKFAGLNANSIAANKTNSGGTCNDFNSY